MKRRLRTILALVTILTLLSAVSASAATEYKLVQKETTTFYYRPAESDPWTKVEGDNPIPTTYTYNSHNDLTRSKYGNFTRDAVKFKYTYKNGKKKTMSISNGSWSGRVITYDKKGRWSKADHESVNAKFKYNSKGYMSSVTYSKSWRLDKRYKETWLYKYNGSKLKKGTHKVLKKNGSLISKDVVEFNSEGLPSKKTTTYTDGRYPEVTTYTYTYNNKGCVKSVVMEKPTSKEKTTFKYTSKKITPKRYRNMITALMLDIYGDTCPAMWY